MSENRAVYTPFRKRPENTPVRRALQCANVLFARIYHRLDVLAPCSLPRDGPAVLVCNHTSGLDPLLIQSVCPRMIVWMMAKEYYDQPGLKWVFRQVEAIPVARSGQDMAATRQAMRALKNGRILGIFPEGKIETTRALLPFQPGVALLAAKAQAEVFPCYLDGTQRGKEMLAAVLHPQHARIAFGPGLGQTAPQRSRAALDQATAKIQASVQLLAENSIVEHFSARPQN